MLEKIQNIDKYAGGNTTKFLEQFDKLKQTVIDCPEMLKSFYWG